MSYQEDHVNEAEFPGVAGHRDEQLSEESGLDDREPKCSGKKEKEKREKKKHKERGYKTFEPDVNMESDDESRKIKKRGSIFRSRFAKKEKEKDGTKPDKKRSKSQDWDSKKEKSEDKKKSKVKEKEKVVKRKSHSVSGAAPPTPANRQIAKTDAEIKPVFGVSLQEAVYRSKMYDGVELPRVFRECIDHVEEYGLDFAGIYRLAGVKSKVEFLKAQYNSNKDVHLKEYDPTTVTSLLKLYLRELPESVLTNALLPQFEEASKIEEEKSKLEVFQMILQELSPCNYTLLSWMVIHLAHVLERESETKMTIQNISIVMCPTMRISHRVLNLLFQHYKVLFRGVKIKKCKKLLKWHPNIISELPDCPLALQDELQRHESILNKMHDDLQKGIADKSTEDELWEVQRVVTQLKRKLRVSRRVSETRIAEKEKEQKDKIAQEVKGEKEMALSTPSKVEKSEVKTPIRHAQKGPAPKAPVPDLPPKQGDRSKQEEEEKLTKNAPCYDLIEKTERKPNMDRIEADLKKVAEKLEQEEPIYENQSTASTTSTKEKMDELRNGDGIKRDFPEELTDSDSDEDDFEQLYDVPPHPIVAAPRIPEKQSKLPPAIPEKMDQPPAIPAKSEPVRQEEDMEMIRLLLLSQAEVFAEQEELVNIRNELQKRIEAERQEITRLQAEVAEAQHKRHSRSSSVDSFEESLVSTDSSSSESGDEEELMEMMNSLMLENQELERKNTLISHDIHNEREAIVELKVKIKLLQDAGSGLLADTAQLGSIYTDTNPILNQWLDKDHDNSASRIFKGDVRKKAETLPIMSRPSYGEHRSQSEMASTDGEDGLSGKGLRRKLERETSV